MQQLLPVHKPVRVCVFDATRYLANTLVADLPEESDCVFASSHGNYEELLSQHWDAIIVCSPQVSYDCEELCRAAKESVHDVPLIVVSTSNLLIDKFKCVNAGADDYIPFSYGANKIVQRVVEDIALVSDTGGEGYYD